MTKQKQTYEVKNIKVSDIEVNKGQIYGLPKNPRFIRDERFNALKHSIEEAPEMLGLRELLVYPYEGKYIVIGGNMRLRACLDLGYAEVPCKVLPQETPVAKLREYVIKDNESFGQNDWDILANEWDSEELKDWGMELMDDWNAGGEDEDEENEAVEDDFDEENEAVETRAKKGDVWLLGDHRLMCGDSTKKEDVDKLMAGDSADLVFTDPPYGVSYVGSNNPNGKEWTMIANDDLRGDTLEQFLAAAFANLANHLKKGGAFYIWFASSNHIQFETAIKAAGLKVKQELIWDKGMVLGHSDYHWSYEPCLYGCHEDTNSTWYGDRSQKTLLAYNRTDIRNMTKESMEKMLLAMHEGRSVWRISRDNVQEYVHPTQKPVTLAGTAIKNSSAPNNIILDLFGGSGSTLIAAEQLDRKCRMMEFDPHYCDVIIARWEKFTGQTATKA